MEFNEEKKNIERKKKKPLKLVKLLKNSIIHF